MKKLRQLPLLLLLTLLAGNLLAGRQPIVIAGSGLTLRAEANAHAKVIAAIPFGEQVTLADDCLYSTDTLAAVKDYFRYPHPDTGEEMYEDLPVTGRWAKVNYGERTGFVFDAYLWNGPLSHYAHQTFSLIYPGDAGGIEGVFHSAVYHFYGVYADGPANQFSLRSMQISYLNAHNEFGRLAPIAEDHRGLRLIIASKQKLRPHRFTGSYFDRPASMVVAPNYATPSDSSRLFPPQFQFQINRPAPGGTISKLTLTYEGWSQTLPIDKYAGAYSISASGDFDGDGQEDFVLQAYTEKGMFTQLYLSSIAEEGEWVGLAATEVRSC